MWNVIDKVSEQVALHSATTGKIWYLLVFVFRLIVVVTIGGSVYSDEQSAFRCSTKVIGCDNVCYDRFAKISHIRFWSFQLLALTAPVVFFHFYTVFVQGKIEKLKAEEEKLKVEIEDKQSNSDSKWGVVRDGINEKIRQRKRKIGKVKQRKVFAATKMEEITLTRAIEVAYFASVVVRMTIEVVFIYLAFELFRFAEYPDAPDDGRVVSDGRRISNIFDLFWIRVPQLYRCQGEEVSWACSQHMLPGNTDAYVPCWVSRPWEKTIFLRYMNTLAVICFFLSYAEMMELGFRAGMKCARKVKKQQVKEFQFKQPVEPNDYVKDELIVTSDNRPLQTSNIFDDIANKRVTVDDLKRAGNTAANNFGNPAASNFGNPAPNNFGNPAASNFGNPAPNNFGNPAASNFGNPAPNNFGNTAPNNFGNPASNFAENTVGNPAPSAPASNYVTAVPESGKKEVKKRPRGGGRVTKFVIPDARVPDGTQSLNRNRKSQKARYAAMFRMGSISFSASESDGGDDVTEGSSDETERVSVSQHSEEYV